MKKNLLLCGLALILMVCQPLPAAAGPLVPTGKHCGDVGPLPSDDYCGCTWGEVFFNGQPVVGAALELNFMDQKVSTTTQLTLLEPLPYYDLSADELTAHKGDLLTLTARFAGQTVSRTFRAWPDANGEQHIAVVFPEKGTWSPWIEDHETQTLALSNSLFWAGGKQGLISMDFASEAITTHDLHWTNPWVKAVVVGKDGHIWAAGMGGVAEFDGNAWVSHGFPSRYTLNSLAVDPGSGAIWLGSGDAGVGQAVAYTTTWKIMGNFSAPVTAVTVDSFGHAWLGTWGNGVYRQSDDTWIHYRAVDGLTSDNVLSAVSSPSTPGTPGNPDTPGSVWFGTAPYISGSGPRGGIARYNLAQSTWQVYTTADGLPADASISTAPAPVYSLAIVDGVLWAGTKDAVHFLTAEGWWAAYTSAQGLHTGDVNALAGNSPKNDTGANTEPGVLTENPQRLVVGIASGIDRFNPSATIGGLPVAQIETVSPLALRRGTTPSFTATAADQDEAGQKILAWDWSSSIKGPICTAVTCSLPSRLVTPGMHTISLRVQDDEGLWSVPVTTAIQVYSETYVPLVSKQ